MRSLLQAQGGALQQLSIIVQQQTPQPIAPFAPNGAAGPGDLFPDDGDYDWTTAPRGAAMAGHALADEHFDYLMHDGGPGRRPTQPQPRLARSGQPRPNRPAKTRPARPRKGATAMAIVSSRLLAVVGLMLVAAVAAYLYFPLTDDRRARSGSRSAAVASDNRKPVQEPAALPDVSSATAAKPRFIARLPAEEPAREPAETTGSALPARIERLSERGTDEPTASNTALPPWTGAPRPRAQATGRRTDGVRGKARRRGRERGGPRRGVAPAFRCRGLHASGPGGCAGRVHRPAAALSGSACPPQGRSAACRGRRQRHLASPRRPSGRLAADCDRSVRSPAGGRVRPMLGENVLIALAPCILHLQREVASLQGSRLLPSGTISLWTKAGRR